MVFESIFVFIIIIAVGFVFYELSKPKKRIFKSLEEKRAYEEQMGRMKAEEDYGRHQRQQRYEESERRKYPFGRPLSEHFFFGSSRKSKKRKSYF